MKKIKKVIVLITILFICILTAALDINATTTFNLTNSDFEKAIDLYDNGYNYKNGYSSPAFYLSKGETKIFSFDTTDYYDYYDVGAVDVQTSGAVDVVGKVYYKQESGMWFWHKVEYIECHKFEDVSTSHSFRIKFDNEIPLDRRCYFAIKLADSASYGGYTVFTFKPVKDKKYSTSGGVWQTDNFMGCAENETLQFDKKVYCTAEQAGAIMNLYAELVVGLPKGNSSNNGEPYCNGNKLEFKDNDLYISMTAGATVLTSVLGHFKINEDLLSASSCFLGDMCDLLKNDNKQEFIEIACDIIEASNAELRTVGSLTDPEVKLVNISESDRKKLALTSIYVPQNGVCLNYWKGEYCSTVAYSSTTLEGMPRSRGYWLPSQTASEILG